MLKLADILDNHFKKLSVLLLTVIQYSLINALLQKANIARAFENDLGHVNGSKFRRRTVRAKLGQACPDLDEMNRFTT